MYDYIIMHSLLGASCFGFRLTAPQNTPHRKFLLFINQRHKEKLTNNIETWSPNPPNRLLHHRKCTFSNFEPKHSLDQSKSQTRPNYGGHIRIQSPKTSRWLDSITFPTKEQTTMSVVIYVKRIWVDGKKRMIR